MTPEQADKLIAAVSRVATAVENLTANQPIGLSLDDNNSNPVNDAAPSTPSPSNSDSISLDDLDGLIDGTDGSPAEKKKEFDPNAPINLDDIPY